MGTYPSALAQMQQVADTTFCPDDDRNVTNIAMLMSPSADRFNVSSVCRVLVFRVWPLATEEQGSWRAQHTTLLTRSTAVCHTKEIVYRTKKRGINDRTQAAKRRHYGSESGRTSATEQWAAVASQLATRKVLRAGAAAPYHNRTNHRKDSISYSKFTSLRWVLIIDTPISYKNPQI